MNRVVSNRVVGLLAGVGRLNVVLVVAVFVLGGVNNALVRDHGRWDCGWRGGEGPDEPPVSSCEYVVLDGAAEMFAYGFMGLVVSMPFALMTWAGQRLALRMMDRGWVPEAGRWWGWPWRVSLLTRKPIGGATRGR